MKLPFKIADKLADFSIIFSFTAPGYHIRKKLWIPETTNMKEKICIITGGNSGIGKAAAKAIAHKGSKIILVCRNTERGEKARHELIKETKNQNIFLEIADMSNLSSVSDCAHRIKEQYNHIDVLINNAGVMLHSHQLSPDGFEKTFATNVLGGFLFTHLLKDLLATSNSGRIIHVSSGGMYTQKLDIYDLDFKKKPYDGVTSYAQSKRAQVILSEIMAEEFKEYGITSNCMHPGWADTPGVEVSLPRFHKLFKTMLRNSYQGADTVVWLATSDDVKNKTGKFWFDRKPRRTHILPSTRSTKKERQLLWKECIKRCGKYFP